MADTPARENVLVVATAQETTEPTGTTGTPATEDARHRTVCAGVAWVALAVVLLDCATGALPDDPLVWLLTPTRLVLVVGLVAVLVGLRSPLRLRSALDPAVAALVLACAVATLAAGQTWSGWRAVVTAVAAYYLAVGVQRTAPTEARSAELLALTCVGIAGTVALGQGLNNAPTGFCRGAVNALADACGPGALIRATGTFPNPNLLAAFLVLLLPLAAVGSAALADRPSRLLGTVIVVVGAAALLWTGSRGGVLGGLAAAGAFVVLRRPTPRRLAAAAISVALAAAALLLAARGSLGVRTDVWAAALHLVATHPWGVGPGRAGVAIAAAVPGDEAFQHAHDLWLNWAVDAGYLGLAAAVAVTVVAGIVAVQGARRDSSATAAALGAGLAGFAVVSIADDPANALRLSLALWVVLGLLTGLRSDRSARS